MLQEHRSFVSHYYAPCRYLCPEQRLGSLGSPANSSVAATLTLHGVADAILAAFEGIA
jgi:hypothetical protein